MLDLTVILSTIIGAILSEGNYFGRFVRSLSALSARYYLWTFQRQAEESTQNGRGLINYRPAYVNPILEITVSLGARVSLLALETLDGGIIWPTHGTVISRIITQLGINMVCVCLLFDRVGTQSAVRANEPASFYWHRRLHQLGAAVGCYEIKAFISACERTKLAKRNLPAAAPFRIFDPRECSLPLQQIHVRAASGFRHCLCNTYTC